MADHCKGIIAGGIVVAVAKIGPKYPRIGGLLLTLPLVSVLAFVVMWTKQGDILAVSKLAKETLILVPLGLPFFVPLALAGRLGIGFWTAMLWGLVLASLTIGIYFWLSTPTAQAQ